MGKYDDIIHTPWPRPTKRARMSLEDRAAQFAPFAALTGYDAVLAAECPAAPGPGAAGCAAGGSSDGLLRG